MLHQTKFAAQSGVETSNCTPHLVNMCLVYALTLKVVHIESPRDLETLGPRKVLNFSNYLGPPFPNLWEVLYKCKVKVTKLDI